MFQRGYVVTGIRKLLQEVSAIASEEKALLDLKERWIKRMGEHIADYDILIAADKRSNLECLKV